MAPSKEVRLVTEKASGIGWTLSPLTHGRIRAHGERRETGAPMELNRIPFVLEVGGVTEVYSIPAVSGNSIRGILRRLLFDEMVHTLGLTKDFSSLIPNITDARMTAFFLRNGGMTPKNTKRGTVQVGDYERLRSIIPHLGLLGGVFGGHHFEGDLFCDFMIPLTKETASIAGLQDTSDLPDIASIALSQAQNVIRYTRHTDMEPIDMDVELEDASSDAAGDFKEQALYSFEVLPAGLRMLHELSVVTVHEPVHLASGRGIFIAGPGPLWVQLGGATARVRLDYKFDDGTVATRTNLEDYREYIRDNTKELKEAIAAIPETLKYTIRG